MPDGSAGPDGTAPTDGGEMDANDGASPAALNCAEPNGVVHQRLGTIARSSNNDNNAVNLFNTGTPNHTIYRAVVPEQSSNMPNVYHVYTFDNGPNITDTPVPSSNGNVLKVRRYPGGLAALVEQNVTDAGFSSQELAVYTLDDSATAWSAGTVLTSNGILQQCANRFEGDLVVINAAQGDFLAEIEFESCGNPPTTTHAAMRTASPMPAIWPLPPQNQEADAGDAGPPPQSFDIGALITSGTTVYSLTNPSGNGGPSPGIGSALFTSSATALNQVTTRELALVNTSDLMQGLSMSLLSRTGNIGVAFLEADLSQTTIAPSFYVGSVAPSVMATLVPSSDLKATTVASVGDLPINGASYHWESFASPVASDDLIAVGSVFPGNNGLNFIWWDSAGNVRAKNTGTSSFFYSASSAYAILGGDATFSGTPFPALGGFEVVYVQTSSDASTLADVWATQINCSP
jgi:hypothetical protein